MAAMTAIAWLEKLDQEEALIRTLPSISNTFNTKFI
jgi:hypothetical protein